MTDADRHGRTQQKCKLCKGSGDNTTGIQMRVNTNICPRCGGYGTVPNGCTTNVKKITAQDNKYIDGNGRLDSQP